MLRTGYPTTNRKSDYQVLPAGAAALSKVESQVGELLRDGRFKKMPQVFLSIAY